ncbi:MAG: hypothetical protein JWQ38_863 [Flavipsychrobacter sp.]|nr:hypothetical protein [Flavipsychrobacter sp.]
MKALVTILFLFVSGSLFAQKADTKGLDKAIGDFDKALIARDSVALKRLLSDNILYGHSNGWIETKKELIADLYNGKLTYTSITPKIDSKTTEGNTVAVRSYAEIDCVMDGKPLSFKLKVLQVWAKKNGNWELFARQSVKM